MTPNAASAATMGQWRHCVGDHEHGDFTCRIVDAVDDPGLPESHPPIIGASNQFLAPEGRRLCDKPMMICSAISNSTRGSRCSCLRTLG
jgi:hypothetical protein